MEAHFAVNLTSSVGYSGPFVKGVMGVAILPLPKNPITEEFCGGDVVQDFERVAARAAGHTS